MWSRPVAHHTLKYDPAVVSAMCHSKQNKNNNEKKTNKTFKAVFEPWIYRVNIGIFQVSLLLFNEIELNIGAEREREQKNSKRICLFRLVLFIYYFAITHA